MVGCAPDGLERARLRSVKTRRAVLIACAALFASIDLVHKSLDPAQFHHARAAFVPVVMAGLVVALVLLVPRIPSNAAALGAGIACGGTLGNLVSLLVWTQGVPDPLVVAGTTHLLAFNLADVFALTGDALLLSAAVVHGVRERGRLGASV
jgi:Signal peptidase (SPase) II